MYFDLPVLHVTISGVDDEYHRLSLPSGITLLTVPMAGVESLTLLVMVRTGSRDEPEKLAGISHFLEHMVFKGTQKYPTAYEVTSAIDSIGGEFNAYTSKEFTGFYIKLAASHFQRGAELLSEILVRPRLAAKDVGKEKGVIIEEINMYDDLPPKKVADVYERLIYGDTNLGRETIGNRSSVKAITRKDLLTYLRQRYTSGRLVIGVVGGMKNAGLSQSAIRDSLGQAFAGLPQGKDGWGKPAILHQAKPAVSFFKKQTGQSHFILGVRTFPRGHKHRYALGVLTTILGGSASSRLFTEIREKRGLAYYVKADIDTYFDGGDLSVSAGVDTNQIDTAVRLVIEQFRNVGRNTGKGSITNEEVSQAKEFLKGRFILELEDSHDLADLFVRRFLLERKILTPNQYLSRISAVTREDIVRVARTIFTEKNLNLAIVGPYNKSHRQRFMKLLRI